MKYIHFIFLFLCPYVFSYPSIQSLNDSDIIFTQLTQHIHNTSEHLYLFEYTLKENETLETLADTVGVSFESIVSLNRLPAPLHALTDNNTQYSVLIPSKSGIFISNTRKFDFETMLYTLYESEIKHTSPLVVKASFQSSNTYFYFLEHQTWNDDIQKRWEIIDYRFPVLNGVISSYFGSRTSPISGNTVFHKGIDISSQEGEWIFSSRNGVIKHTGYSKIFGYFIEIEHQDDSRTLYGHILDSIHTIGDTVLIGEHIAYMGSTGMSTGVHTHFELSIDNVPVNPLSYLIR